MITLTINGKEIRLEKPVTVLEAARQAGIKIPTLCYYEQLEPYGGCRLCLIEVEKMPRLQTACTLMAADGMVVRTESAEIAMVRRGILEFLLINHPLDCPYCDKAGECELQDLVEQYGATAGRYKEKKRKVPEAFEDPILVRNMERCIVCTRCVRMCNDVQGALALSVINRAGHSHIEPFSGGRFDCEYCGNCVSVCPVGSIMSRLHRHSYRPWQIDKEVNTVCPYCGVGCSFTVQVRDETIIRTVPKIGLGHNNGLLCSRGRFGYEFVSNPDRLRNPLIKKNGKLEPATWDEALSFISKRLKETKDNFGGDAIGGIASPRCTNEDNYILQKFMRVVLGSPNIDSISRLYHSSAHRVLEDLLGQGVTANIISGLKNSDTILVIGGDPTAINPILGLQIRAGGRIITIGPAGGLERFKTLSVIPPFYREPEFIEILITHLFEAKGPRGERQAIEDWIKTITQIPAKSGTELITHELAEGLNSIKELLLKGESVSIVLGPEIVQRSDGHRALYGVAALTYILEARLYLLSERPNEQGIIDMGCLPDMLPGGRPVSLGDFRRRFEEEWNADIPQKEGLTIMEMIEAARSGSMNALYVMGENLCFNLPNNFLIEEALRGLDFLVVQDIFLTETARMADVVLPALSWAEKDGTYTNLERRIQRLRKAVDGVGMEDWRIISEVSKRMGYSMDYSSSEDIMNEIGRVSPLYRGLTYREIETGKTLWPYKGEPLRGEIKEIRVKEAVKPYRDGRLYLALDRPLFHSGTLSSKASGLRRIYPEALLKVSPETAERLNVFNGEMVKVSTDISSLEVRFTIDKTVPENVAVLSNIFEGAGAYRLLGFHLDPITKVPGIEGWEVRIERK
jgi:NADH-quinone oxidoreductase chain G